MKITMYELLGMIEDDKAPKKIKYKNVILSYRTDIKDYAGDNYFLSDLIGNENIGLILNDEVEILDKDFKLEKKIPEKIDYIVEKNEGLFGEYNEYYLPFEKADVGLCDVDKFIIDKINEIIDYLESKGE